MDETLIKFKEFVKKNPSFIYYVKKGDTSWQSLYEIYSLYGENSEAFNKYLKVEETVPKSENTSFFASFAPLIESFKGLDMNTVQKGIDSLQKGIGLVQEFVGNKTASGGRANMYRQRPVNKYFDD